LRDSSRETRAWIRFVGTDATTEWTPVEVLGQADNPIRLLAFHGDRVLENAQIELAVSGQSIELINAAVFDNRLDDDAEEVEWDLARTEKGQTSGKIIPPALIDRREWGADPFRGDPIPLARPSYDLITFHHAACCSAFTYQEGVAQVKGIQRFHQDGRGWSDIGYQFLLDQSGRLYQGRPFMNPGATLDDTPILAQGAHVGGANTGNIGVSVLGCYHPPEGGGCTDVLSPAALDSLIAVLAFLSERYGVPPSKIMGHRDFSSTACPGNNNYSILPEIRNRVRALLLTGNRPVGSARLAASADSDGVVTLDWQFTRDDGIVSYRVERVNEQGSAVVFQADIPEDLRIVDANVRSAGSVVYHLRARNADGRLATLAVAEVDVFRPSSFELSHSFPNPTVNRSKIRYFLSEEGFVTLELYDATGRLLDVLVDQFQREGRWYVASINSSALAAGQYYYRMQVEGFSGIVFDKSRGLTVIK